MIIGSVSSDLEAVVRLPLWSPRGEEQLIDAVIDTGFSGFLTLPPGLVAALGLRFLRRGQAVLGDGGTVIFDTYEAFILWDDRSRRISVDAADTDPLLGMSLLAGSEVSIQVIEGGETVIRPLALS
jgi:clan AA aspartic protease